MIARLSLLVLAGVIAIVCFVFVPAAWLDNACGVRQLKQEWRANPALFECAAAGDPRAQTYLGMLYWMTADSPRVDPAANGLAIGLSKSALRAEGKRLLEAGAAKGICEAHNELGYALLKGRYGMPIERGAAVRWLRSGDRCGDIISPYNLARLRQTGVLRDGEPAMDLLWRSARRGYKPAFCTLARLHERAGDDASAFALRTAGAARGRGPCRESDISEEFR